MNKWLRLGVGVVLIGAGFFAWGIVTDDRDLARWGVYTVLAALVIAGVVAVIKGE